MLFGRSGSSVQTYLEGLAIPGSLPLGTAACMAEAHGPIFSGLFGCGKEKIHGFTLAAFHFQVDDSNDMWEDQEEEEEDEEDGLAGQLLSDILATSKYGKQFERTAMVNTFSLHRDAKNGVPKKGERWAYKDVPWTLAPSASAVRWYITTQG